MIGTYKLLAVCIMSVQKCNRRDDLIHLKRSISMIGNS